MPLYSFSPAGYADWLAQVQRELKDPNAAETLRWHTAEGFVVEPYYPPEQLGTLPLTHIQAAQRPQPGWLNTPMHTIGGDLRADNARLRDALANGADALLLHVPADANLSLLLNGIRLSETPVYFSVMGRLGTFLAALRNLAPYQVRGGLMSALDVTELTEALTRTADAPNFRVIHIDGGVFHQAGATATQEVAFMLAHLVDVFDQLTDAGYKPDELAAKTSLSLAVGTSYFLEIAKLRALRTLLARLAGTYPFSAASLLVHARTSAFYEAAATPHTNLLRATTEAMAAVLGGCDLLTVRPYDAVLGTLADGSEFGQRLARNVSNLLRDECQLGYVADPAAGSYYLETLTHQLVEAAWALFMDVERRGGLTKSTGYVQALVNAAYAAKVEAVRAGRVLVGVNKFRHDDGQTEPVQPAPTARTNAAELVARRLAEPFE